MNETPIPPVQDANANLEEALRWLTSPQEVRPLQLRSSALRLQRALRDHIRETEGPQGFLSEMQTRAPRLAPRVSGLYAEHATLDRDLDLLIERLFESRTSRDLDAALALARSLRRAIREHQTHANDLFFQAFCVDIGPCD